MSGRKPEASSLSRRVQELRDLAAEKARATLGSKGAEWIDDALDGALVLAGESLEGDMHVAAVDAIETVREHKGAFLSLARDEAWAVLQNLWEGYPDRAEGIYLATFDERRKLMQAGTDATILDRERRELAYAELLELVEELGALALRAVVPLILAGAGL